MENISEYKKMKEAWDNLDPYFINWSKIDFANQVTWLVELMLGSFSQEGSVYIFTSENQSYVIYDEFDFKKRLQIVYDLPKDEYSLELIKDNFSGSIRHYKQVLNSQELKLLPSSFRREMKKTVTLGEPVRISTALF